MAENMFIVSKGHPQPLGNKQLENGINFSIFSKNANDVTLCFFLNNFEFPIIKIPLDKAINKTGDIWHIFIHDLPNDYLYTYQIDGETDINGNAFESSKFLLDPYAKAVYWGSKNKIQRGPIFGVISEESTFEWEETKNPKIPMNELIIYEMHVRGFTQDESSGVNNKGTFLGVIEKIPYLLELGINAIELMPIQEFNEKEYRKSSPLNNEPLCDYWGYSSLNFFSLNTLYASGKDYHSPLREFKTMVRELHRYGIEVIIDVVFNHTGEGNILGPTISFKGIDNSIYYILDSNDEYYNFSGCGNTFNCNHPVVANLILDALRYFVLETKVDGFRFDLATILNRDKFGQPQKIAPLVEYISQDPILAKVKLIAEPWDAAGFYQVGNFYPNDIRWSEWNGRYRDTIRSFFNGINRNAGKFATRISGSQDLYHLRAPFSSINFITSHDGFSLYDLVSYNHKHNLENGEENRDGLNHNISWNCGSEGTTLDENILKLRQKQMKNFHFTLMISQGVPLIYMGDEYGHTKDGNNNTWCQDNKLNWFLWGQLEQNSGFFRFYRKMIEFRKNHSVFRKKTFLTDRDVIWHGIYPYEPNFNANYGLLSFTLIDNITNENLYIAINSENYAINIVIPIPTKTHEWHLIINTGNNTPNDYFEREAPIRSNQLEIASNSCILLKEKLRTSFD
jgi:isoamylase/glycogen operon protein